MAGRSFSDRFELARVSGRGLEFANSLRLRERAHAVIPGGSHTYAKGDDQFPEGMPGFIVRGRGAHVWDADGNEFIEYGLGLRAVTLGHAFEPVVRAVTRQLAFGSNFTRPSPLEVECAEELLALIPGAEMAKFCKDGSLALDGAVRLARAHTGRDRVAICGDHPFFSSNDWFIGVSDMPAGTPQWVRSQTVKFRYNDVASLEALFDRHPDEIACVVLEAARIDEPAPGFLPGVQALCRRHGALLVFDELITGFRWHLNGAQALFGVTPDLSTFGKAMANGFSLSALVGRRDIMQLGGFRHERERVFLLSTTHGAETHSLAAGIAAMRFYRDNPVIEHLYRQGARLRAGIAQITQELDLDRNFGVLSRDCNLLYYTRDAEGRPSQPFRTLVLQELLRRGILAPSLVVSYSHTDQDIDRTLEALAETLRIYRRALDEGVDRYLEGRPVKPVFRRYG